MSGCQGWAVRGHQPLPAQPGCGGCAVPQPRVPQSPVLPGPGPRPCWCPAVPAAARGRAWPSAPRCHRAAPPMVRGWCPSPSMPGCPPARTLREEGDGSERGWHPQRSPAPRPRPPLTHQGPQCRIPELCLGCSQRGLCGTSPCAWLLRGDTGWHTGTRAVPVSCLVAGVCCCPRGVLLSLGLSISPAAGPEPPVPAAHPLPLAQQEPARSASAPP